MCIYIYTINIYTYIQYYNCYLWAFQQDQVPNPGPSPVMLMGLGTLYHHIWDIWIPRLSFAIHHYYGSLNPVLWEP